MNCNWLCKLGLHWYQWLDWPDCPYDIRRKCKRCGKTQSMIPPMAICSVEQWVDCDEN